MKKNINIQANCPPLGAHTSIAGGLHLALERGVHIEADVIQIFSKNQRQWQAPPLKQEAIVQFQQICESTGVKVACIHTSYLINIAAPNKDTYRKSIEALKDELYRAAQLKVPFIVLHPGSYVEGTPEKGMVRVVAALNKVMAERSLEDVEILLETTAGQGTQVGRTLEELAWIVAQFPAETPLGICVDTCHVFAAGYEIHTPEGWRHFKTRLRETVGIERVKVLHLNDSRMPLGSHRDRHARIGEGHIGLAGFRHIVQDPAFRSVPQILEIPGGEAAYREDIVKLRHLCSSVG